jgi:hypothetical protein
MRPDCQRPKTARTTSATDRIRQNRPRLASRSESCFLLEGTNAIAVGSFCPNPFHQDDSSLVSLPEDRSGEHRRGSNQPPQQGSMTQHIVHDRRRMLCERVWITAEHATLLEIGLEGRDRSQVASVGSKDTRARARGGRQRAPRSRLARWVPEGSPVSRAESFHACTGSPTAPGPRTACRYRRLQCGLLRRLTASAPGGPDFAARWLACACPCQRFACALAVADA